MHARRHGWLSQTLPAKDAGQSMVWFYLYQVLERAKLIYGYKKDMEPVVQFSVESAGAQLGRGPGEFSER